MGYDEIDIGVQIPPLTQDVSILQTAMYCAVTWDFARQHYDREYARHLGFAEPVIDPQMYGAVFSRFLTDWVGPAGWLKALRLRYRSAGFVGDTLTFRARVTDKYVEGDAGRAECELAVENQDRECLVTGTAVLAFEVGCPGPRA